MDIQSKNTEYQLMINSPKRTIKIEIPNGPLLVCHGCWDYKTNFSETVLKTITEIKITHPLLKVEPFDLKPITSKKTWQVTILRQPKSNLKDDNNSRKK